MPDQSASPLDDSFPSADQWPSSAMMSGRRPPFVASPEQLAFLTRLYDPPKMTSLDDQGVSLSMDDTLRVREQSIYAAALITDCTPFPEDDAEKVVEIAKRFEKFIRSGQ